MFLSNYKAKQNFKIEILNFYFKNKFWAILSLHPGEYQKLIH